jgi:hypothetical protein
MADEDETANIFLTPVADGDRVWIFGILMQGLPVKMYLTAGMRRNKPTRTANNTLFNKEEIRND